MPALQLCAAQPGGFIGTALPGAYRLVMRQVGFDSRLPNPPQLWRPYESWKELPPVYRDYGGVPYYYPLYNSYRTFPSGVLGDFDGPADPRFRALRPDGPPAPPRPVVPPPISSDLRAHLRVRLPAAATLWFGTTPSSVLGPIREFQTPPLNPGIRYTYDLKASWNENGQPVIRTQRVEITAGEHLNVELSVPEKTVRQPASAPDR